jgi:hypothetical protein
MRRTISQYYINEAVKRGVDRQQAQAGSVTFLQRFGGSLNANWLILDSRVVEFEDVVYS